MIQEWKGGKMISFKLIYKERIFFFKSKNKLFSSFNTGHEKHVQTGKMFLIYYSSLLV